MVVELGFKPGVYPLKAPSPWGSGKELKLAWVGAGRWPTPAKVNTQALRGGLYPAGNPPLPPAHTWATPAAHPGAKSTPAPSAGSGSSVARWGTPNLGPCI